MKRTIAIATALLLAAGLTLMLLPLRGGSATATSQFERCDESQFDTYDAGPRFRGHDRTRRGRSCENPEDNRAPVRMNFHTSIYGDCVPLGSDGGCPPPLEVQSWPACERNLSLYAAYPSPDGEVVPHERTRVRGTEAAVFDGGHRIEVYTGDATVVVMGESPGLTRAAANALVGKRVAAEDQLPAPQAGALAGEARC